MLHLWDVAPSFGSESRGEAAQKRGEIVQNMRFAHVLHYLSSESKRHRREHTSAMRTRHIVTPQKGKTVLALPAQSLWQRKPEIR